MPVSRKSVINVSTVPNPSPFRYPGGKSWLIPYVRQWLNSLPGPLRFAEPFAGGANVGLTVAIEELAKHVTLVELDRDVASVWKIVLNGHSQHLADRITEFRMSKKAAIAQLKQKPNTMLDRAFSTIVKNRVRRGGILNADASLLKLGENGRGVRSRWYPETLKKRIETISAHREKITFVHGDGLSYLRAHRRAKRLALFIDPPYTVAGERLYTHSELDHRRLFEIAAAVSGNVLMTYDNTPEVRSLAREFGFQYKRVAVRTTHHSVKAELLISREFSWLNRRTLQKTKKAGQEERTNK
jgi:DNA adenine methylase